MNKKIRVFTIDDSPIYRQILREIINSEPDLEYGGFASNGVLALKKIPLVDPDIITLDVEMPEMNGIETLERIMKDFPKPVIMLSSFTKDGAEITFKALELGAVDYIPKPELSTTEENIESIKNSLITKIKLFSNFKLLNTSNVSTSKPMFKQSLVEDGMPVLGGLPSLEIPTKIRNPINIVCIGSSTGGTVALSKIIPNIDKNIGVPIVIVQHMPKLYTNSFAKRLDAQSDLKVLEAQGNEALEPNTVYIAQGGLQMLVKNRRISLEDSQPVNSHKPSVDPLFYSVAIEYKDHSLAIILTGMGHDGSKGIEAISNAGGFTVAQDEESSVIFGMPGSAIKTGKINRIIPLDKIATFINDTVRTSKYR